MPQEFDPEKMNQPLPDGQVKPQDPVKVYATAKTQFIAEGEEFTVHSALADKLIKSGKATKSKQKAAEPAKTETAK